MIKTNNKKYKYLLLSLLFDGIGMLSYAVPFFGDLTDVVWAPISAYLMTRIYKGKIGQVAGVVHLLRKLSQV